LLGAFVQINPVWLYGPFRNASVTTYAQPDFALGWVEGAMRLFPGWEITFAHRYRIAAGFWPAVFFPAMTFLVLYAWPFIDKRLTRDRAEHHVIERPRDRPLRSAFGLGVLTFYAILLLAGSQDIIASQMNTTIEPIVWTLRIAVIVVPVIVGAVSWHLMRDLERSHEQPEMADAPTAPNEVPAEYAPSPVGAAPELLALTDGAVSEPSLDGHAATDATARPVRRRRLAAALETLLAVVVSFVVEFFSFRDRRKLRKRRQREGRIGSVSRTEHLEDAHK
jgi:hypothetical protein